MADLPKELEFLKGFYEDPALSYKSASWLLSGFNDNVWLYSFGFEKPSSINWELELHDGSFLTDEKNILLLTSFRHFLIASTRATTGIGHDVSSHGT